MVMMAPSAEKVSSSMIAGHFAVDGIGEIGAEFFQVGLVDAAPDLFIRGEQDLDGAVFDLRL